LEEKVDENLLCSIDSVGRVILFARFDAPIRIKYSAKERLLFGLLSFRCSIPLIENVVQYSHLLFGETRGPAKLGRLYRAQFDFYANTGVCG
jgi:hypothetical protein